MKRRKATGPDKTSTEELKTVGEFDVITQLLNNVGYIPELLKPTFIALPK